MFLSSICKSSCPFFLPCISPWTILALYFSESLFCAYAPSHPLPVLLALPLLLMTTPTSPISGSQGKTTSCLQCPKSPQTVRSNSQNHKWLLLAVEKKWVKAPVSTERPVKIWYPVRSRLYFSEAERNNKQTRSRDASSNIQANTFGKAFHQLL